MSEAAGDGAEVARALEVERVARRLADRHPDPEARRVYAWIAERATGRALQPQPRREEVEPG